MNDLCTKSWEAVASYPRTQDSFTWVSKEEMNLGTRLEELGSCSFIPPPPPYPRLFHLGLKRGNEPGYETRGLGSHGTLRAH